MAEQLEPFTESPYCPKCSSVSVKTRFRRTNLDLGHRESLGRTCNDCGFSWFTETADKAADKARSATGG